MYVLKVQLKSGTIETDEINEYTLRRTCTHVPLTNAWVVDDNPDLCYVVFPRIQNENDIKGKKVDAEVVLYADKKKLERLSQKDKQYKFKEA
jgi:hypothetical protein